MEDYDFVSQMQPAEEHFLMTGYVNSSMGF